MALVKKTAFDEMLIRLSGDPEVGPAQIVAVQLRTRTWVEDNGAQVGPSSTQVVASDFAGALAVATDQTVLDILQAAQAEALTRDI